MQIQAQSTQPRSPLRIAGATFQAIRDLLSVGGHLA